MKKLLLIVFAILIPALAYAGVTIHYSGRSSSEIKSKEVLVAAEKYAKDHKWEIKKTADGITLFPSEWCEHVELFFKGNTLVESFVKTQFAGPEVHKEVVGLFKSIKPYMRKLDISDEGEYWETGDYGKLTTNIESVNIMMTQIKSQRPNVRGPIKLPSGRIIDLKE